MVTCHDLGTMDHNAEECLEYSVWSFALATHLQLTTIFCYLVYVYIDIYCNFMVHRPQNVREALKSGTCCRQVILLWYVLVVNSNTENAESRSSIQP